MSKTLFTADVEVVFTSCPVVVIVKANISTQLNSSVSFGLLVNNEMLKYETKLKCNIEPDCNYRQTHKDRTTFMVGF